MIVKEVNKGVSKFINIDGNIYTLIHYFYKDSFKQNFEDLEDVITRNLKRRIEEGNKINIGVLICDFMADKEDIINLLNNTNSVTIKGYCYNEDNTNIFNITLADIYLMNDKGQTIEVIK